MTRRDILKAIGAAPAIPAVKAVEELKLSQGDAIVLKFPDYLPRVTHEYIQRNFAEHFKDTRVIVLDGGADIEVLRKA